MEFNKRMKYKDFIKQFGLEPVKDGYRVRQLEKLRKEYEIEKEGTYYTIKRKLNEIESISMKNNPTIKDYVIPILYAFLRTGVYTEEMIISRGQLMKDLNMINENFYYVKENPYECATVISENLDGVELYNYAEEARKMFNQILTKSLKELVSKSLAEVELHKLTLASYKTEDGKIINKCVPVSDKGKREILIAKNDYLREKGWKGWNEVSYWDKKVAHAEIERRVGFKYFEGFKFILYEKGLEMYINENYPEMIKELNQTIESKLMSSKRKNIRNLSSEVRLDVIRTIHGINPTLNLRKDVLGLDNTQ